MYELSEDWNTCATEGLKARALVCVSSIGLCISEVVRQWTCLLGIQTTQAYQDCMTTFNNTVAANNFCPAVQENGRCLNNVYNERCADLGVRSLSLYFNYTFSLTFHFPQLLSWCIWVKISLQAGYYGCESFRITFDNACWDTRCVVAWQR